MTNPQGAPVAQVTVRGLAEYWKWTGEPLTEGSHNLYTHPDAEAVALLREALEALHHCGAFSDVQERIDAYLAKVTT